MDGLIIAHGSSPLSFCKMYSAIALVYVYVFGRGFTISGVNISTTSSVIHLKKHKQVHVSVLEKFILNIYIYIYIYTDDVSVLI